MSNPYDGGPAFPPGAAMIEAAKAGDRELCESCAGMSLRDYFAAAAIHTSYLKTPVNFGAGEIAKLCYEMADAMISQRNKKEP